MKYFYPIFALFILFFLSSSYVLASSKDGAISDYSDELRAFGMSDRVREKAEDDVDALIDRMESEMYDVKVAYDNIDTQVNALVKNGKSGKEATDALESAKGRVDHFTEMEAEKHIRVETSVAGAPPYVTSDDTFVSAHDSASAAISKVRRILISPDRPGAVPAGDIVSDFLPQIIRQLFRFAWVAVLVSLTVSGVMFVMAHDEDERITKAKNMLLYSLIGFAFVALAFALVKAVTSIDFFNFV